jgi:uncharacterized protein (TIGR03663 family)
MRRGDIVLLILLLITALLTRFVWLDVRPMDHDESVHAWIALYDVLKNHNYVYNPAFHGPFLYFATALSFYLFGDSDFTARIAPALFSVFGVFIAFSFRRWIGNAAYILTFFMLFSPSILYYSRYLRNDLIVVSSFLAALYFYLRYREENGKSNVFLVALFLAIIFTSKENWVEYLPLFLLFIPIYGFYIEGKEYLKKDFRSRITALILGLAVFITFSAFLYSSAFVYLFGGERTPLEAITDESWIQHYVEESLSYWISAAISLGGEQKPHFHPIWFYSLLLLKYEFLAVALAFAGIPLFWQKIRRLSFLEAFSFWWMVVALLFYHIMSYKTPWLVVHIATPMILFGSVFSGRKLFGGIFNDEIVNKTLAVAVGFAFLATLVVSLHINYINYTDAAGEELIYVQTQPEAVELVREIKERLSEGKSVAVYAIQNQYWPLPWMLRGEKNVVFVGDHCPTGFDYVFTPVKEECEKKGLKALKGYRLRVGYVFWEMVSGS